MKNTNKRIRYLDDSDKVFIVWIIVAAIGFYFTVGSPLVIPFWISLLLVPLIFSFKLITGEKDIGALDIEINRTEKRIIKLTERLNLLKTLKKGKGNKS